MRGVSIFRIKITAKLRRIVIGHNRADLLSDIASTLL
jgi:hypothetical protein